MAKGLGYLLFSCGLFWSLGAQAASFDCERAGSQVEKTICSDPELSKLDDDLSATYRAPIADVSAADQSRREQRRWLAQRSACRNPACIRAAYEARLRDLRLASSGRLALADDYARDPAPIANWGRQEEPYEAASDPLVCPLYLQNLQYFVRHNLPVSCGQPVAPTLADKIKPVQWTDSDPVQYPELFKALVGASNFYDVQGKDPSPDELEWARTRVKNKMHLFRRASLELKGHPTFRNQQEKPRETKFQIIEYGPDITNSNNPEASLKCDSQNGRITRSRPSGYGMFYLATEDLSRLYGALITSSDIGMDLNLWLIHGQLYSEAYNENGDVKLSEFHSGFPVESLPVCLYHYVKSQNAGAN